MPTTSRGFIPKAFIRTIRSAEIGIPDPRKTFHSLRHTFKTALDRAGVPRSMQDDLCGHEDNSAGAGYVHGESVEGTPRRIEIGFGESRISGPVGADTGQQGDAGAGIAVGLGQPENRPDAVQYPADSNRRGANSGGGRRVEIPPRLDSERSGTGKAKNPPGLALFGLTLVTFGNVWVVKSKAPL